MEYIYIGIVVIALYALLKYYFSIPTVKGLRLEKDIHKRLKKYAINHGVFEFHDLMIKDGAYSSQIDNVLLTRKAIYVIEAKNYHGHIFGSYKQDQWTMTVKHVNKKKSRSGKVYYKTNISKHQFYNPIKQNQTHINKLKKVVEIPENMPLFNIVVFGSNAYLREVEKNDAYDVIHAHEITSCIDGYEQTLSDILTYDALADIIDHFEFHNIIDKNDRKEHVRQIKERHQ